MIGIDNANPGTAEVFFAVALVLALVSALAYAVRRDDTVVWAPVLLALSVASVAAAFWVA